MPGRLFAAVGTRGIVLVRHMSAMAFIGSGPCKWAGWCLSDEGTLRLSVGGVDRIHRNVDRFQFGIMFQSGGRVFSSEPRLLGAAERDLHRA